jgi:hypothetical protein
MVDLQSEILCLVGVLSVRSYEQKYAVKKHLPGPVARPDPT